MNIKLVGILLAVGAIVACGDDTSDSGGSPASGGNGAGPSTGGNGAGTSDGGNGAGTTDGGGGGAPALTCDQGCEILFNCGLEGTPPLCVYTAADEDGFVPQCIVGCMNNMALLAVVDAEDCPNTIETVSIVNADFADFCENGAAQGGAGGGN